MIRALLLVMIAGLFTTACSLLSPNEDPSERYSEMSVLQGDSVLESGSGAYAFQTTMLSTEKIAEFTISSSGDKALKLTGTPLVEISGTDAALFSVTQPGDAEIATDSALTFQITFKPDSVGSKSAVVSIVNNSGTSPYSFSISGLCSTNVVTAPTASLTEGAYKADEISNLTLSSTTAGASIRYTLDGSDPDEVTGILYDGNVDLTGLFGAHMKAVAYKAGMVASNLLEADYTYKSNTTSLVDDAKNASSYTIDMIIDSSDKIHIAYTYQYSYLKYLTNENGAWNSSVLNNEDSENPSLDIDSNGKIHISYWYFNSRDLRYMTNASGSWSKSTVYSDEDSGRYNNIHIDSNGYPMVLFNKDYTSDSIMFSQFDGSVWHSETLANPSNLFHLNSVQDMNGMLHAVSDIQSSIKYFTNTSGAWTSETAFGLGGTGAYMTMALAVDSDGYVHIVCDNISKETYYVSNKGGSWNSTKIGTSNAINNIDNPLSIINDPEDKQRIVYFDSTGKMIMADNGTGSWVKTTLEADTTEPSCPNLGYDSQGKLHIVYQDNGSIRYLTSW